MDFSLVLSIVCLCLSKVIVGTKFSFENYGIVRDYDRESRIQDSIMKYLRDNNQYAEQTVEIIERRGITVTINKLKTTQLTDRFDHEKYLPIIDSTSYYDFANGFSADTVSYIGCLVVISAHAEQIPPSIFSSLHIFKEATIFPLVMFIDDADEVSTKKLKQSVEDLERMLTLYGYNRIYGRAVKYVLGSTKRVLAGDKGEFGAKSMKRLLKAMNYQVHCDKLFPTFKKTDSTSLYWNGTFTNALLFNTESVSAGRWYKMRAYLVPPPMDQNGHRDYSAVYFEKNVRLQFPLSLNNSLFTRVVYMFEEEAMIQSYMDYELFDSDGVRVGGGFVKETLTP